MATNHSTLVVTADQRWLVRLLCRSGVCGLAVLLLLFKVVPFKWLYSVKFELAE